MARDGRGRRGWVDGGPRPGDPAAGGPRPAATARDVLWSTLGAVLLAVTVFQTVRLAWTLATSPDVDVTGLGAILGFLVTFAWFWIVYWVAAGAWRRTVWGCPFQHVEDAPWERRCSRHALVTSTTAALDHPATDPR